MRESVKYALTLGTLVALGYFIAWMAGNTYIAATDEPGTTGKFGIYFALGFAVVLGWALLSGLEAVWKKQDDPPDEWWAPVAFAVFPRLFGGTFVFFIVVFIAFGFERLGVGLGAE